MATQARIGYPTLLRLGSGSSPQTFTTIAEVVSINGFGFTAVEVEVTNMDSPNGYTERIAGMKDGDVATFVLNMTRDQSLILKTRWEAGTRIDMELNLPSTLPDFDFSIAPLHWGLPTITPSGVIQNEITGRITGSITGGA